MELINEQGAQVRDWLGLENKSVHWFGIESMFARLRRCDEGRGGGLAYHKHDADDGKCRRLG